MVDTRTDPGESSELGKPVGYQGQPNRGVPVTGSSAAALAERRAKAAVVKGGKPVPGSPKTRFEPIGIGKPLLITLESVYLGPNRRGKDVLVTSQVKDPLSIAAGVMSMNMAKYDVEDRAIVEVGVDAGSEVVYYKTGCSNQVDTGRRPPRSR
jgi:hypothetical protein